MTDTPFTIECDDRFNPVVDVFKAAFADGKETGASFAIYKNGKPLIHMLGGWTDRRQTSAINRDTLFSIYSSGKVPAALVIAWLVDQDRIGYDQPVASLWPEFSQNGKDMITIGDMLSHQTGLTGITNPAWTPTDYFDWEKTVNELAAQAPVFTPQSASGYSPITYGYLIGEIARRADKEQRTLGTILREDICHPFDLDIWIGLPDSEHERCAQMQKPRALTDFGEINAATQAAFLNRWSSPGGKDAAAWRRAEIAGSNCHATADSLARLMQVLNNGIIDGQRLFAEDMPKKISTPRISGPNLVLPFDLTFAAGVMHNSPNFFFGPTPTTVGHSGWGGSCVFADSSTGISGAYAMNRQDNSLLGDPRPVALINALYNCL